MRVGQARLCACLPFLQHQFIMSKRCVNCDNSCSRVAAGSGSPLKAGGQTRAVATNFCSCPADSCELLCFAFACFIIIIIIITWQDNHFENKEIVSFSMLPILMHTLRILHPLQTQRSEHFFLHSHATRLRFKVGMFLIQNPQTLCLWLMERGLRNIHSS